MEEKLSSTNGTGTIECPLLEEESNTDNKKLDLIFINLKIKLKTRHI